MGEKDGQGVSGVSHSICRDCWLKHYPEYTYPEKLRRCPKNQKVIIYCGEETCTLDCEIYQLQSGYTSELMNEAIRIYNDP